MRVRVSSGKWLPDVVSHIKSNTMKDAIKREQSDARIAMPSESIFDGLTIK